VVHARAKIDDVVEWSGPFCGNIESGSGQRAYFLPRVAVEFTTKLLTCLPRLVTFLLWACRLTHGMKTPRDIMGNALFCYRDGLVLAQVASAGLRRSMPVRSAECGVRTETAGESAMSLSFDLGRAKELEGYLGDHCFDLDSVGYDPQSQTWRIFYASYVTPGTGCLAVFPSLWNLLLGRKPRPRPEHVMDRALEITAVQGWNCEDRAKIGTYTFHKAKFDAAHSRLVLHFCEDCDVFLKVGSDTRLTFEPGQDH
jgi:hypothetical protein